MDESIMQVIEKNAVVKDWSLRTQKAKWDSLKEGYTSDLPERVTLNASQNDLDDLTRIWKQWDSDTRGIFTEKYGDIAYLIAVNVNEQLIQAMVRFWDPAYQCFTFNQENMILTIEEYAALLRIDNVQLNKIYVKELKPMIFKKKLMKLRGMIDIWAKKQIKKKNEVSCDPWFSLRELVQNHLDGLKIVDLFALAIYGLIVFPKVLGHVEVTVVDFFKKLRQGINPVPTILAETFRSLNACRKKGEWRFIGCAQLLNVWIFSHFWKVERTPFHMFSKTFAPLEVHLEKDWPKDITEQHWVSDWVPLLRLWGGVGYASLMVQRQITSRQFVPVTDGLAQSEFAFMGEGYMKRSQLTPSIDVAHQNLFSEEIPSELELTRFEFERKKAKLLQDISSLQEENYQLKIDVQIEKSRIEKVQKEVEVTRRDLMDLHLENKKLRGTIRNSGLEKSSVEWMEELSNIKGGIEFWKAKAKKEEERAARAMIELRKKSVEYETLSAELTASQSEPLKEKNGQYDRDIHAYKKALQEKNMHLGSLINEILKADAQILQLSDEAEVLNCQYPPSQRRRLRAVDAKFNERMKRMERTQRELQEQLAKSQQKAKDLMERSREESLEQRDQMAKMMELMTALVKGNRPMQSPSQ
ncbi:hypothetical protein Goshw_011327 [Gossypium schwendimanii]|uniref:DUF7745 domain-containing protein n=1 Tax=Gossypium schwendimanii TaxID=34291 RepID=A0A7J9NAZ6_GOSSC|nr:hypothetical protein [Gossypium schwendimanii]